MIQKLQAIQNTYLRVATGCVKTTSIVSVLTKKGKTCAFNVMNSTEDLSYLSVFKQKDTSHEEISATGEKMLLQIYKASALTTSLEQLRYLLHQFQIVNMSLTAGSGFELKSVTPTSDAAQYHSFRTYLQVQHWLGNTEIQPTEWGWTKETQNDTYLLVPAVKNLEVVPENVLHFISCGCKQGCDKNCKFKNAGLLCKSLCSRSNGKECSNCGHDVQ